MLVHDIVVELDVVFGPFALSTCNDLFGANSHFAKYWTLKDDARFSDWDALNIFCNPPFSAIFQILSRFLFCKTRAPVGTAAVFVLPVWRSYKFWELVCAMPRTFQIVRRFEIGEEVFTAPGDGLSRVSAGPLPWPVVVAWVAPTALVEVVPDI